MKYEQSLISSLTKSPAGIARLKWLSTARPEQIITDGDWTTYLILSGRGWGKTRTGAEDVLWRSCCNPGWRIAVVAPTYSDVRRTCFEGDSGLLSVIPEDIIDDYNRSNLEITLKNSSIISGFSAERPHRLRGPQFNWAWADELAVWPYTDTWDQLMFSLRIGKSPKVIVTSTPRNRSIIKDRITDPGTLIVRGSTMDNAENLAPSFIDGILRKYDGTRLGRQEIYGDVLEDLVGSLWTRSVFDQYRCNLIPEMKRIVVAVDPSGSNGSSGDAQGIVVAGSGVDGRYYVLADRSCRLGPAGWANRVSEAYDEFSADLVVAEKNYGGAMVESTIRTVSPDISYKAVVSSSSKSLRAEPVAALYDQGKVSHFGIFNELEDEASMMGINGYEGKGSPNRLDALVFALTELSGVSGKRKSVVSVVRRRA